MLKLTLQGQLKDRAADDDLGELFGKTPLSFEDQLFNLRKAAQDKRIKGVLPKLELLLYGWARAEELRDALTEFKKSGKFVLAYAEMYAEKSYSVALAADEILSKSGRSVGEVGLGGERLSNEGM